MVLVQDHSVLKTKTGMYSFIRTGLQKGLQQWRIAAIVYGIQLLLVMTFGIQVYDVLKASIGHSLEINKLAAGYDHTVIMDFLSVHGASITPLLGQLRWLMLVWLLFSVFTNGGLLYCAVQPEAVTGRVFWQGGAKSFFTFLKISVFLLLLVVVWSGIVWIPTIALLEPMLAFFSSEKYIIWVVFLMLMVWFIGLGLLFVWSVCSRLYYFQGQVSTKACLMGGWRFFGRQRGRLLGLFAAFAGFKALLMVGYLFLDAFVEIQTSGLVVLFFLLQQAVVFGKIQIRQMVYAGIGRVVGVW